MKTILRALVIMLANSVWAWPVHAEMSSTILSEDTAATLRIGQGEIRTPYTIAFPLSRLAAVLPPGLKVVRCELRLVAELRKDEKLSDQDVAVLANDRQVGQWSAYYKQPGGASTGPVPYRVRLDPQVCKLTGNLSLKLKNLSEATSWTYDGGGAASPSEQPRLIVSFESAGTASGTGLVSSTGWKYDRPDGAFDATLVDKSHLATNALAWNGALYFVGDGWGEKRGPRLVRRTDRQDAVDWPLAFDVPPESFAFVTVAGRLVIVTARAIHYCDLGRVTETAPVGCTSVDRGQSQTNSKEPPAMGEDGSLYLRSVAEGGSLVAFNPLGQRLWRSAYRATRVSPITLNEDGRYAFLLASIDTGSGIMTSGTYMLRIDTATGASLWQEIVVPAAGQSGPTRRPDLGEFLQPVVIRKRTGATVSDYVFVGGRNGVLQLYESERRLDDKPSALVLKWTDMSAKPMTIAAFADGSSILELYSGGSGTAPAGLKRLLWFDEGVLQRATESVLPLKDRWNASGNVFIASDASGMAYLRDSDTSLVVADLNAGTLKWATSGAARPTGFGFAADGTLIEYSRSGIRDRSPMTVSAEKPLNVATLSPGTIYGSAQVTIAPNAAAGLSADAVVVLKGGQVSLPSGFAWPTGPIMRVRIVSPE